MRGKRKVGLFTRQQMIEMYREGMTSGQIAVQFNVTAICVRDNLQAAGVKLRSEVATKKEVK